MVEVGILFYKSEKKSSQTVRPIQIKAVLVFYQGCLVLTLFVAFTILLTYSVKKDRFITSKYYSKIGQDGGIYTSANHN